MRGFKNKLPSTNESSKAEDQATNINSGMAEFLMGPDLSKSSVLWQAQASVKEESDSRK
jgi:hypothetical protein